MNLPKDIELLSQIEKEHQVVSLFQYQETSAWISIKELLTAVMYDSNVRLETGTKKEIASWLGMKTMATSLKHYLSHLLSREKKSIFLGASTGLFRLDEKVMDSYFPYYDISEKDSIYMFNCGNLRELDQYSAYVKEHRIVVENYLVVVFKKLLAKVIYFRLKKAKKHEIESFATSLNEEGISISSKALGSKYAEFIAGYRLYRLFFKFLNIERAYMVSAPTKSDMVASLQSLAIEVVEVQHGVVGKLHRGYNFNFEPNRLLPTVDRVDVYNQFWKDEVVKAGYFKAEQMNIVGRLKYDIVKEQIEELNFKYIFFTGQGAFFEQIIAFFKSSDSLLASKNIKMFYKAHPRELESEIDDFKKAIKMLKCCSFYEGEYTTEELIKNASAHVSVFSSCHFDAIYYKEKTYVLDVMDENIMSYYAQTAPQSFVKVKTIEEVLDV